MLIDIINFLEDSVQALHILTKNTEHEKEQVAHSNKLKKVQECLKGLKDIDKVLWEIVEHPDEEIKEEEEIDYSEHES
jgi:hypothetical protein